jgi:hypothetical protein
MWYASAIDARSGRYVSRKTWFDSGLGHQLCGLKFFFSRSERWADSVSLCCAAVRVDVD